MKYWTFVWKIVILIKFRVFYSRLFKRMCEEIASTHSQLFFCTRMCDGCHQHVWWLAFVSWKMKWSVFFQNWNQIFSHILRKKAGCVNLFMGYFQQTEWSVFSSKILAWVILKRVERWEDFVRKFCFWLLSFVCESFSFPRCSIQGGYLFSLTRPEITSRDTVSANFHLLYLSKRLRPSCLLQVATLCCPLWRLISFLADTVFFPFLLREFLCSVKHY